MHLNYYNTDSSKTKKAPSNGIQPATINPANNEKKSKKKEKKADKIAKTEEKPVSVNNTKPKAETKSKQTANKTTNKTSEKAETVVENSEKSSNIPSKTEKKADKKSSSKDQSPSEISSESVNESSSNAVKSVTKTAAADSPKTSAKQHKPTSKKMASLEASIAVTEDDFPSLATHGKPLSATAADSKTKGSTNSVLKPSKQSKSPELSDADYPSLSSYAKAAPPGLAKPPPGLSKPPPGLSGPPPGLSSMKPATNGVSGKPPGLAAPSAPFSMSSLAAQLENGNSFDTTPQYIEPINMAQRNKKLSFKLKDMIYNNMDKFHKFRNLSSDFRSDLMTAQQFYDGCVSVLHESVFLEILPELLVLLPDIQKQQDLYILAADTISKVQAARSWSSSGDTTLSQCEICGQVIMKADASHHNAAHGIGVEDYPTLSTSSNKKAVKVAW